jgi:ketosteroid isomerase-like protein
MEPVNDKTGMTHGEAREFIRRHFEEFVNKKNVEIGNVNFAADFVDHGADVPPGMPPGPAGAIAYVAGALKRFPDLRVTIEDMIAEDDRVVVRNHWTATDSQTEKKLEFRGIVIWRIRRGRLLSGGHIWKRRVGCERPDTNGG